VVALLLAPLLGGGGFYAVYSGILFADFGSDQERASALPDVGFVPLEQVIVNLRENDHGRHLRFGATLEVNRRYQSEVEQLMPRILDVLNSYLRALDTQSLAEPGALIRLRAQMLRRVQIVTGEGRVRDLLITEFVLN
jgi:flagellar protein FliL